MSIRQAAFLSFLSFSSLTALGEDFPKIYDTEKGAPMSAEVARKVAAKIATSLGYHAVEAQDGHEALARCKQAMPDLVLTDWNMPEMDGIELAQRCAAISPRTKVMFITGFAAVTLKASREAPQAKVLSKPFHLKDLVMEVERIFGQAAQASI